jgi:mRNA interferase MazF
MTGFRRGDVVLVNFVFADESGIKRRPAVVVSSDAYHRSRQETILAGVTSRTDRLLVGDHLLRDWEAEGLLLPSVATGVVRTVKQSMIARRLGGLSGEDMGAVEENLRIALGLPEKEGNGA